MVQSTEGEASYGLQAGLTQEREGSAYRPVSALLPTPRAALDRLCSEFSGNQGRDRGSLGAGTCVRVLLLSIGPHGEGQLPLGGTLSHLLPSITAVQLWGLG